MLGRLDIVDHGCHELFTQLGQSPIHARLPARTHLDRPERAGKARTRLSRPTTTTWVPTDAAR